MNQVQPEATPAFNMQDRVVSLKEAAEVAGFSLATLKRRVSDPGDDFPKPFFISQRRKGILLSSIQAWAAKRAATSR